MKKTPTIYERDWNGDKSRVVNQVNPICQWVFDGEGIATRKIDGTCCAVIGGKYFKRREVKPGQQPPPDFILSTHDRETGKNVGWVPVTETSEDKYHLLAWKDGLPDGTYELVGDKIQGGLEPDMQAIKLIAHNSDDLIIKEEIIRAYEGISEWLGRHDVEGIVFHHPDGRMAKIKKRDFGLPRKPSP